MIKKFRTKLETAFEVRDAYSVAEIGVPGAYEEARRKAAFAKLRFVAENPNASKTDWEMSAKEASYEVYLGRAYMAEKETIKAAARDMAVVATFQGSYVERRPHIQRAATSIMRMIHEHKLQSATVSSRRE